MSRTDKDAPDWVQVEYYEPFHRCGWIRRPKYREVEYRLACGLHYTDYVRVGYHWEYLGDCDLSVAPVRHDPLKWTRRSVEQQSLCFWRPEPMRPARSQLRGMRKTAWCRVYFHKSQRNKVRTAARRIIQCDWDVEFPDGRTRHSVYYDMN